MKLKEFEQGQRVWTMDDFLKYDASIGYGEIWSGGYWPGTNCRRMSQVTKYSNGSGYYSVSNVYATEKEAVASMAHSIETEIERLQGMLKETENKLATLVMAEVLEERGHIH